MSAFLDALAQHRFLQHAVIAGLLAAVGCGIMGTYVVVKRLSFLAGGIAHAVLGGMGAAYYFGAAPLGGAMVAAVLAAVLIGWVSLHWSEQEDTLIGALWAIGMAIGVLFIAQTPGYRMDLMSYLFGNILLVTREDLILMTALDAVIVALVLMFSKQFLAVCFDEELARLRGVRVDFIYLLLLCMVALTVVLLIRVVGIILVIAMMTIPAAIARQYLNGLGSIMLLAGVLGAVFCVAGIVVSYAPDWPAGATIILLAGGTYIGSTLLREYLGRLISAG